MKKLIAIVGPTASGKTKIGVRLAKKFSGEIVSADSRQVYRGLDIGTGKEHFNDVRQWLIDIVEPPRSTKVHLRGGLYGVRFSVFDWLELAREVIDDIFARGKVPIVVGGTGLYVQALVEGFFLDQRSKIKDQNDISKIKNREQLDNLTIEQLRAMLKQTNPAVYNEIDLKNRYRIIRAIERTQEGFKPIKKKPDFEVLQIGPNLERKELYKKIDDRVEERFEKGMLEEMINLLRAGISIDWMIKIGLEYKIIGRFVWEHSPISCLKNKGNSKFQASDPKQIQNFNDQVTNVATPRSLDILKIADDLKKLPEYEAMKQELKWKIHAFARRQLTWFRRFPEIHWLDNYQDIELRIKTFIEK